MGTFLGDRFLRVLAAALTAHVAAVVASVTTSWHWADTVTDLTQTAGVFVLAAAAALVRLDARDAWRRAAMLTAENSQLQMRLHAASGRRVRRFLVTDGGTVDLTEALASGDLIELHAVGGGGGGSVPPGGVAHAGGGRRVVEVQDQDRTGETVTPGP